MNFIYCSFHRTVLLGFVVHFQFCAYRSGCRIVLAHGSCSQFFLSFISLVLDGFKWSVLSLRLLWRTWRGIKQITTGKKELRSFFYLFRLLIVEWNLKQSIASVENAWIRKMPNCEQSNNSIVRRACFGGFFFLSLFCYTC